MIACLKRLSRVVLFSTLVVWARQVSATTIVIARPPTPSPDAAEVLTRLRGELLSVGFEAPITDRPAGDSRSGAEGRAWLEQLADERGAAAVLEIVGDDTVVAVDVWVLKAPGRFEVTRVAVEPKAASQSSRFALRALEALRASLLEVDWAARQRRDAPVSQPAILLPPPQPQKVAEEPRTYREPFGLELGAAALMSLDGVGPALLPMMRVGWAARSWLWVQVELAGLGTRPTVATTLGSARVAQEYGVLAASYRFRSDQRLWPFFSLGAGVLHTSLEGQAGPGTEGHTVGQWSFLAGGSLGAGVQLHARYYLTLAAHVQMAMPYVAIHIVELTVATSGRPNLLLTCTLGAWL